ncbi:DUF4097 domain-containing protein [Staphylococcus americanisciuri]|uniref:DUF4097 domain-containing protein n=1 Tax=Staphylococcus americanisciuri TaxID=2973940 RepID=A0ABT2F0X8_9STAP|nr:DUF4097 domain-containing protein [Staphylococcus americanisciuri]MCS4486080.1 DUF4097 domain-containing protein [Staphylococcus americanisciuri]
MKKINIIILVAGLVFALVGMTGAFYYSKIDNKYQKQEIKISQTFDANRIKNIELSLKKAQLNVVVGDTFKLEGKGNAEQPKITTQGDTLKLQLEGRENEQTVINVNPFYYKKNVRYTLTVPKSELSRLNINSNWSSVDVHDVKVKDMIIKMEKGALDMEGAHIGSLEGSMRYGAFDVEKTQFSQVAMTVRKGGATFEDVPADIPMMLDNHLGTIDVSFAQPLQNVSLKTDNSNGFIDMEDLKNYVQIEQRDITTDSVINIKNREGTITLED